MLHSICQQIWKTQQTQEWKRLVSIPIPKIGNAKECSTYCTIALISHISKVMLKILQVRLLQYVNHELPEDQAGFRKTEELEIKLPTSIGSLKKQESSRKKHLFLLYWLHQSLCVDHKKLCNSLKEMGIPNHLTCLLRNLYAGQEATVRTEHGTTGWLQIGKGVVKAVNCYPANLTYMQSASWEMPGWMKHNLKSRFPGEISITDMQMTPPLWQKVKKN